MDKNTSGLGLDVSKWGMNNAGFTTMANLWNVQPSNTRYFMVNKTYYKNSNRIRYTYQIEGYTGYSVLHLKKYRYSEKELQFIDELFNGLDKENLLIIKGIVNNKYKT